MPILTPQNMHEWYLEATQKLHPESFNPNAQKPYEELTEEQKFIDKYMAEKAEKTVMASFSNLLAEKEREAVSKMIALAKENEHPDPSESGLEVVDIEEWAKENGIIQ